MASLIPICGVASVVALAALAVLSAPVALCVGLAAGFLFYCIAG